MDKGMTEGVTKFFYDCEFYEDGKQIHLISLGMVCEDSANELYMVNKDAPWDTIYRHPWLRDNVMPSIQHEVLPHRINVTDTNQHTKHGMRSHLMDYVDVSTREGTKSEFWAYRGAYDQVVVAQLFGTLMAVPLGLPQFTMDLKQLGVLKGINSSRQLPPQSELSHNALADARYNLSVYRFLQEVSYQRS